MADVASFPWSDNLFANVIMTTTMRRYLLERAKYDKDSYFDHVRGVRFGVKIGDVDHIATMDPNGFVCCTHATCAKRTSCTLHAFYHAHAAVCNTIPELTIGCSTLQDATMRPLREWMQVHAPGQLRVPLPLWTLQSWMKRVRDRIDRVPLAYHADFYARYGTAYDAPVRHALLVLLKWQRKPAIDAEQCAPNTLRPCKCEFHKLLLWMSLQPFDLLYAAAVKQRTSEVHDTYIDMLREWNSVRQVLIHRVAAWKQLLFSLRLCRRCKREK